MYLFPFPPAMNPAEPPPPPPGEKLLVFIVRNNTKCGDCGQEIDHGSFVRLDPKLGALCMACADMDELEFLASGDAALTRRAAKYSSMTAVVLKWSRSRKRYERQGIVAETAAIERAETECLADAPARERQRQRRAVQAVAEDAVHAAAFVEKIRTLFPSCPPGEAEAIATHACRRHSGRVGRTAAAKELDETAVTLAVRAAARHRHTRYDKLLDKGVPRDEARTEIAAALDAVLMKWRASAARK